MVINIVELRQQLEIEEEITLFLRDPECLLVTVPPRSVFTGEQIRDLTAVTGLPLIGVYPKGEKTVIGFASRKFLHEMCMNVVRNVGNLNA